MPAMVLNLDLNTPDAVVSWTDMLLGARRASIVLRAPKPGCSLLQVVCSCCSVA
jgi:hypothetical protein